MLRGEAQLAVEAVTRTYVSNEGAEIQDTQVSWRLFVQSMTKAEDGMELPLYLSYYSRTAEGLPPERQMLTDVREMLAMSARLRTAPMVDPYSGPAILSGRAAGVFFHEIFGHRVEGHRQRNADDAQTFAGRVGQPVLPPFLSVVFDPTQAKLGTTELAGHYLYDDEGVKAQRVTVVDKGVLKTFLLSRRPLKGFPVSNGHGRGQTGQAPVSRQSNLLVESTEIVPHEKLIAMLKDEARRQGKTYGLLFDNIQGGFTFTGRDVPNAFTVQPLVVYRIHTDDRPAELVRGVDLIGTPLAAFGKIAATSDQRGVFNGMCGAESGSVPVAAASPALLVTEVEVQKKSRSQDTRPILPAPAKKDLTCGYAHSSRPVLRSGWRWPQRPCRCAQESPILVAMREEMQRAMAGLRLKDEPAPYYIAYTVTDAWNGGVISRLGSIDGQGSRARPDHCRWKCGSATIHSTARASSIAR